MNERPKRKPNRLVCYDYRTPGYYFVTICTHNKDKILWDSASDGINLSASGQVVNACILDISNHYPCALVDKYVVMPNHVHIILQLLPNDAGRSIADIIGHMKRAVSKETGFQIWQKGFHDHIIRSEPEYQKIWLYIDYNPTKWAEDCYYSE